MKKLLFALPLIISFSLLINLQGQAQDYNTAIGLRGGPGYGLTIKQFVSEKAALEGIVSPLWDGFLITALYEKHGLLFRKVNRLRYYGGGGGHVGFWNYDSNFNSNNPWVNEKVNETVVGVDLIIGLEYTFKEFPFNIGVDWKPMLNLVNDGSIWFNDIAFSLRLVPGKI